MLSLLEQNLENIKNSDSDIFWDLNSCQFPIAISNKDFYRKVYSLAQYWKDNGIKPGDVVALCLINNWLWQAIEMSLQLNGAIVIGLEENFIFEETEFVNESIKPVWLLHDKNQSHILNSKLLNCISVNINLVDSISKMEAEIIKRPDFDVKDNDMAVMICTSGTTGKPKLISYSHNQIYTAVNSIKNLFLNEVPDARIISWLPLSLLFQRVVNLVVIHIKGQIHYLADPKKSVEKMAIVKPTVWIAVPKFYEHVEGVFKDALTKKRPVLRKMVLEAMERKTKHGLFRDYFRKMVQKFVSRSFKKLTGGNVRLWISGSAPLKESTYDLWSMLDCKILQAYGVSENIMPISMNTFHSNRKGSVGKPLSENNVKIDEDGEILVKSEGVTINLSANHLKDGYYKTGDIGHFDQDGFLYITGRKNEMIKISNGKKIFPAKLEEMLIHFFDLEQVFVGTFQTEGLCALIYSGSIKLGVQRQNFLEELNNKLPKYAQLKKIYYLERPLDSKNNELTLNFKFKRHVVEKKYGSLFQGIKNTKKGIQSNEVGTLY